MKKISILLITLLLTFGLMGCQLAEDNTITQSTEDLREQVPYIPIEFNFEVYDLEDGFIDVSEYFYFSWFEGTNFHDEYLTKTTEIGKSMEVLKFHSGTHVVELDGDVTQTSNVEDFEVNVFIGRKANYDALYPNATYMSYDGDTYVGNETGLGFSSGMSLTSTYEVTNFNGEDWTIIFKMNIVVLDELQTIEVREFDESDNLIKTTTITEESLLDELILDSNTEYYFIVETFKDAEESLYTERYYFPSDEGVFHKYKFLNEDGFVYLDYLHIRDFE